MCYWQGSVLYSPLDPVSERTADLADWRTVVLIIQPGVCVCVY